MCWHLLSLFVLLCRLVGAIEVAPNSVCSPLCDDNPTLDPSSKLASSTQTWNLHCQDWELVGPNATADGRTFKSCLTCQSTSAHYDQNTTETDVLWFLFNMRFTIDWCIYGYPNNPNQTLVMASCNEACMGPNSELESASTVQLLSTNSSTQYQYCDANSGAFPKNVEACVDCVRGVPNSTVLVNYLHALNEGCRQRPTPGDNTTIQLSFDLFPSATALNPFSSTSMSTSSATATSMTVSSSTSPSTSTHQTNRGLAIGLGAGLGCAVIIICVLGILLCLRKPSPTPTQQVKSAEGSALDEWTPIDLPKQRHDHRAELSYTPALAEIGSEMRCAELGSDPTANNK